MPYNRLHQFTKTILIIAIFLVSFLHLTRGFNDPDFFWHLKTGEWICQNKALQTNDPFAFTTPQTYDSRKHFILTSGWLSQITLFFFYYVSKIPGIIVLRFIIIGLLAYIMIKRKHGDGLLYLGLFIIFLTQLLEAYNTLDRPQTFSFLFFAALLYFLEKIKDDGSSREKTAYFSISILMLFWANMHGGHVLGRVIIVLYILMEGVKFMHPALAPIKREAYRRLLIAGTAGLLASLINPNTYHAMPENFSLSAFMMSSNREYLSIPETFRIFHDYSIFLYWFILSLTVISILINPKKTDITQFAILAGTGYFSFTTMRYIPFFMMTAVPLIGRSFSLLKENLLGWSRAFICCMAIFVSLFFTWDERFNVFNLSSGNWFNNHDITPETAVDFILDNNLKGNMYNHYNYGGYLIWRLAPERKVFIDGRNMYEHIFVQSMIINNALEKEISGMPYWKFNLDIYGIKFIIVPVREPGGEVLTLINALINDKDWAPVFSQSNSMIFVKISQENKDVIRKHEIPRDYLMTKLL